MFAYKLPCIFLRQLRHKQLIAELYLFWTDERTNGSRIGNGSTYGSTPSRKNQGPSWGWAAQPPLSFAESGRPNIGDPARQDQQDVNGTKSAKPVANEWKLGRIRKHVIGKTAEWACTREDGVPGLRFSERIPLICAENSTQNQRSVLPGIETEQLTMLA